MPARLLPTSDTLRLEAMRAAKERLDAAAPEDVVLSTDTVTQLNALLPQFDQELRERSDALGERAAAAEALQQAGEVLRMYISHFLQSFNNAVARGEFSASERTAYQLLPSQESLPDLGREDDLVTWANRLITGETNQTTEGRTPVTMPPIADVQAKFDAFQTARAARDAAVNQYGQESADVTNMRDQVIGLIRDIWDEVEFAYRHEEPSALRRLARAWGVEYRFREGEAPDPEEPAGEELPTEDIPPPDAT